MSRSLEEIRNRIDEITEILESGVSSITVDGTVTALNLASLRVERRSLENQLPEFKRRRPRAATVRLDGC